MLKIQCESKHSNNVRTTSISWTCLFHTTHAHFYTHLMLLHVSFCSPIFVSLFLSVYSNWKPFEDKVYVYKNDQQQKLPSDVDSHSHTHFARTLRVYKSFWIVFSFRCVFQNHFQWVMRTPLPFLHWKCSTRTLTLTYVHKTCLCMWVCVSIETAIVIVSSYTPLRCAVCI